MEGAHRQFHPMKRRATPIPVAPPRIPTPMPVVGNNNNGPRSISVKTDDQSGKNNHLPSALDGQQQQQQQRLISKTPFRLLDNDVKTAWINPRLMSKIDLEVIKHTDYVPPHERNMNGRQHHHQHHVRPSSCGRVHDREWEAPPMNGRGGTRQHGVLSSSASSSVPTATQSGTTDSTGVVVRRASRSKPAAGASFRAKTSTTIMPLNAAKLCATKNRSPLNNNNNKVSCMRPGTVSSLTRVPPRGVVMPSSGIQGHHHRGVALTATTTTATSGYHQQNVVYDSATAVFGVFAETKYVYAVNGVSGHLAQASAAAAFFARDLWIYIECQCLHFSLLYLM
ncbi:hypothetical protein ABEB36_003887 [Hypothenemus hampei]|uniref:Uncharacterized protein n=1 Tax=Hypothenemus hampei TaxID=57062 RepID=A0ABD1F1G7_HYPHA